MTRPRERSVSSVKSALARACLVHARSLCAVLVAGALGAALSGAEAASGTTTVYVPDYYGSKLFIYTIPPTPPRGATFKARTIALAKTCSPNSVVVLNAKIYIACTASSSGIDQILVFDTASNTFLHPITGVATDKRKYFNGLIGMVLDPYGNLWVSSYNNNYLLRINAADLASKDPPVIDRSVVHSPDSPAGLAIDPKDGSIWIVGQFNGGIALSLQTTKDPNAAGYGSSVNQAGRYLGASSLNLSPIYCISGVAGDCPQRATTPFDNPEGIAVFANRIWVSSNGGDHPGAKLTELTRTGSTLSPQVIGGRVGMPFSCPGGLFASTTLWVNDEDYGRGGSGQPRTACGANDGIAGDQGDKAGRVLSFTYADLTRTPSMPTPEMFQNWTNVSTASPGFGGIFVTQTAR